MTGGERESETSPSLIVINKDLMDVVRVCRHRLVEQWLLFSEAVKTKAEREERLTLDVKSIFFFFFFVL